MSSGTHQRRMAKAGPTTALTTNFSGLSWTSQTAGQPMLSTLLPKEPRFPRRVPTPTATVALAHVASPSTEDDDADDPFNLAAIRYSLGPSQHAYLQRPQRDSLLDGVFPPDSYRCSEASEDVYPSTRKYGYRQPSNPKLHPSYGTPPTPPLTPALNSYTWLAEVDSMSVGSEGSLHESQKFCPKRKPLDPTSPLLLSLNGYDDNASTKPRHPLYTGLRSGKRGRRQTAPVSGRESSPSLNATVHVRAVSGGYTCTSRPQDASAPKQSFRTPREVSTHMAAPSRSSILRHAIDSMSEVLDHRSSMQHRSDQIRPRAISRAETVSPDHWSHPVVPLHESMLVTAGQTAPRAAPTPKTSPRNSAQTSVSSTTMAASTKNEPVSSWDTDDEDDDADMSFMRKFKTSLNITDRKDVRPVLTQASVRSSTRNSDRKAHSRRESGLGKLIERTLLCGHRRS